MDDPPFAVLTTEVRAVQFDFAMVLVFLVAGVLFALVNLLIGSLLRPRFPSPDKELIYECGERPIGSAWFNFNPRFYIIALVFVIFEVEIALTIPVAVVLRQWVFKGMGLVALIEILAFIAILFTGLIWIWARKDLEWVKRVDADRVPVRANEPAPSPRMEQQPAARSA